MMTTIYSAVPQEMQNADTWLNWRFEIRDGRETKVPVDAKTNGADYAKSNDERTWSSFSKAVDVADILSGNDVNGIGFVFTEDKQGADLDGVVEIVNGVRVIDPFAVAIAKIAKTYCEFSPSGTGVHLIWQSSIPLPPGRKKSGKKPDGEKFGGEIYDKDSPRYFTVTADKVPELSTDSLAKIEDPNVIQLLHFLTLGVINEKLTKLWLGKWRETTNAEGQPFPSQSEADLALCNILAKGGFDTFEKIDAAFRRSGLMRSDWTHKRKYTIKKALGSIATQKPAPDQPTASGYEAISGTADQITPKKIVWLWPNRLAQKLNLIVGNPDLGKGLITYYIAACCTTGRAWFDAPNTMEPSEVLLLNGEEDWDDTVVPRLMAAGADRSKVRWLKMSATKDSQIKEKELQLDRDISALEKFLREHPTIRLVVVDPISNYLGSTKMIDEQRVRDVLTPLKEIANRHHVTIVGVMHLNKKVELDAIHRIGGAMAFVGVARMVWLVAPKPNEDGSESDEMLMVKVKGNIVQRKLKGLSFTTKVQYVPIEGEEVATPYVEWIGDVDQSANQVTGKPQKPAHRPSEQLPACITWLREYLKDGAKLLKEEIEPAGQALFGFSSKTIQRAREQTGIITFESGKQVSKNGKNYPSYSCRLSATASAQIDAENEARF